MALEYITNLSPSWKIIIAQQIFKNLEDGLGGSPLRRKVAKIIQFIYSILIKITLYVEVNEFGIIAIPII